MRIIILAITLMCAQVLTQEWPQHAVTFEWMDPKTGRMSHELILDRIRYDGKIGLSEKAGFMEFDFTKGHDDCMVVYTGSFPVDEVKEGVEKWHIPFWAKLCPESKQVEQ